MSDDKSAGSARKQTWPNEGTILEFAWRKLSLCLTKHYPMKAYGGEDV
jgi:hypothetical protein